MIVFSLIMHFVVVGFFFCSIVLISRQSEQRRVQVEQLESSLEIWKGKHADLERNLRAEIARKTGLQAERDRAVQAADLERSKAIKLNAFLLAYGSKLSRISDIIDEAALGAGGA